MKESDEESRNVHTLLLDYYANDEVAKDVEGPGKLGLRYMRLYSVVKFVEKLL